MSRDNLLAFFDDAPNLDRGVIRSMNTVCARRKATRRRRFCPPLLGGIVTIDIILPPVREDREFRSWSEELRDDDGADAISFTVLLFIFYLWLRYVSMVYYMKEL